MDATVDHLGKLETEALWDQAFAKLSSALYAGQFEPGSVLPLRTLAERFGTSITPVRDAVSRLVALGVLERGTRNAALVPQIRIETLVQMTAVRCSLEGLAAREAAMHGGADAANGLRVMLDAMRQRIRDNDLTDYLDIHRQFHFQVYAIAGNPVLSKTIENLWLRFGPLLAFVVPDYVRQLKGTDHHEALVRAVSARDSDAAEKEIIADIREAAEFLGELCRSDGYIRRGRLALGEGSLPLPHG